MGYSATGGYPIFCPMEDICFESKQSTRERYSKTQRKSRTCSVSIALEFQLHLCSCHLIDQSFNNASYPSVLSIFFFFSYWSKLVWVGFLTDSWLIQLIVRTSSLTHSTDYIKDQMIASQKLERSLWTEEERWKVRLKLWLRRMGRILCCRIFQAKTVACAKGWWSQFQRYTYRAKSSGSQNMYREDEVEKKLHCWGLWMPG